MKNEPELDSIIKPIGPLARLIDSLSPEESAVLLVALATPEAKRSKYQKEVITRIQNLVMFLTEP